MKLVNWLLAVWTVLVLVFFYLPIAILIGFSFNTSRLNIVWEGFTLDWYAAIWRDAVLVRSLKNSLIVAAITTVLSVVLGTGGAWLLYRYRFPRARLLETLVFVPMIMPEVIMGVSLLILFVDDRPRARLHDHHHLARHLLLPVRAGRGAGASRGPRPVARGGGARSRRDAGAGLPQGAGART